MTDDLIAFLRARLDETERIAQRAGADHPEWSYDRETFTVSSAAYPIASRKEDRFGTPINDVDGEHIAANDPARVLRQVQAHRAILEMHAPVVDGTQSSWTWFQGSESKSERILCLIAAIWSDHPDFREEWR